MTVYENILVFLLRTSTLSLASFFLLQKMAKEEQSRVRSLLLDTVSLLCKNGLTFKKQLKIQGLLGITLDEDDVFIVHINDAVGDNVGKSRRASGRTPEKLHTPRKRGAVGSPAYKGSAEKRRQGDVIVIGDDARNQQRRSMMNSRGGMGPAVRGQTPPRMRSARPVMPSPNRMQYPVPPATLAQVISTCCVFCVHVQV